MHSRFIYWMHVVGRSKIEWGRKKALEGSTVFPANMKVGHTISLAPDVCQHNLEWEQH